MRLLILHQAIKPFPQLLMKSEVVEMALSLGVESEVAHAIPTDGLWDCDKTDEQQLGVSYSQLEWAMNYDGTTQLTSEQKKVLKIYYKLHSANRHKMLPVPVYKKDGI